MHVRSTGQNESRLCTSSAGRSSRTISTSCSRKFEREEPHASCSACAGACPCASTRNMEKREVYFRVLTVAKLSRRISISIISRSTSWLRIRSKCVPADLLRHTPTSMRRGIGPRITDSQVSATSYSTHLPLSRKIRTSSSARSSAKETYTNKRPRNSSSSICPLEERNSRQTCLNRGELKVRPSKIVQRKAALGVVFCFLSWYALRIKVSSLGVGSALFFALLPFFTTSVFFYSDINSKFFLAVFFADILALFAAYHLARPKGMPYSPRWRL